MIVWRRCARRSRHKVGLDQQQAGEAGQEACSHDRQGAERQLAAADQGNQAALDQAVAQRREVAAGHWQLLAEPLQLAAWVREFVVQQEARRQPSEQSAA